MCIHEHTELTKPDGTIEEFDLGMVRLVTLLWEIGVRERFSCEGDPHFVDQTHFDAQKYRAKLDIELDRKGMEFVAELMLHFPAFYEEKVSWEIDFDRDRQLPWKTVKDYNPANKIALRFPHQDIAKLVKYLEYKKERAEFNRMTAHLMLDEEREETIEIEEFLRKDTEN